MKPRLFSTAVMSLVLAVTPSIAAAKEGAALYKTKCSPCHGASGAGDTAIGKKLGARALGSAEVQKQDDAALSQMIVKGKNKMPSFDKKLKPEQIKAIVAHIRTFAKK